MVDEKLEQLYNFDLWSEALEHIACKSIKNSDIMYELNVLSNKSVILSIIEEIKQGVYKVGVPTVVKVKKDNGGFREIYVNSVKDRVVLRVINFIYQNMYKDRVHNLCVSYKKGMAVGRIIKNISNTLANTKIDGYKLDISKFFDTVSKESLIKALNSLSTGSVVDRVIMDYYCDDRMFILDVGETLASHNFSENKGKLVTRYKGLAQGCALSSFLCNYILRDIDEYFSCSEIYYRYSDDIVIFNKDKGIVEKLSSKLKDYGLTLNPNKVEKVYPDKWFTFLGFSIKGELISISKKSLYKFQDEIRYRYLTCKTYNGFKMSVYSYLFSNNIYECRGWFGIKVGTINSISDIKLIDMWVQDMFLAYKYKRGRIGNLGYNPHGDGVISRGKGRNVRRNREKGKDEEFISMLSLYYLYAKSRNLYLNELIVRGIL